MDKIVNYIKNKITKIMLYIKDTKPWEGRMHAGNSVSINTRKLWQQDCDTKTDTKM